MFGFGHNSEAQPQLDISRLVDSSRLELKAQQSIGKIRFGSYLDKQAVKEQRGRDSWRGHTFESSWSSNIYNGQERAIFDQETRAYLDRYAPEASQLFQIEKGEGWFDLLNVQEMELLKSISMHGYKKLELEADIRNGLDVTLESQVRAPIDDEERAGLIRSAMSYDLERRSIEEELQQLANRAKEGEVEGEIVQIRMAKKRDMIARVDRVLERRHKQREEARALFELPNELSGEEMARQMDVELNEIFPALLDSAAMLTPEAKKKLMGRLGVIVNRGDESYTFAASDGKSEGEFAMRAMLIQRIRNRRVWEKDRQIQKGEQERGLYDIAHKEGADLLVLHAFEVDGVADCGRYFQEQVRRVILQERMKELVAIGEHTPPNYQDLSDREVLVGAGRALQDLFFAAEGVMRVMSNMVDSVFTHKAKPGSFLHRVSGSISETLKMMADGLHDETSKVPKVVPAGRDSSRWRDRLAMPDFFHEDEFKAS